MRYEGKSLSRTTFAKAEEKMLTNKRKRSLKTPRGYINYDWWRLAQKKAQSNRKSHESAGILFFSAEAFTVSNLLLSVVFYLKLA